MFPRRPRLVFGRSKGVDLGDVLRLHSKSIPLGVEVCRNLRAAPLEVLHPRGDPGGVSVIGLIVLALVGRQNLQAALYSYV